MRVSFGSEMTSNQITIRLGYVEECERCWREAPVQWKHNKVTNSKTVSNVDDAKAYIKKSSKTWRLDEAVKEDRVFLSTLYHNCEYAGASAQQHFTAQYTPQQQYGICKYILVVVYNDNSKITIAYAYHDIEEDLFGSNSVYTEYAEEITKHWLTSKSVESMKEMLPNHAWPAVIYQ